MTPRREICFDRVAYMENIAHLLAIAVNGEGPTGDRLSHEMRDPPLVSRAALMRPVDAAHPQHHGRHAETAGPIEHILIGATLRAAIGRVEVERPFLAHAMAPQPGIARQISIPDTIERNV